MTDCCVSEQLRKQLQTSCSEIEPVTLCSVMLPALSCVSPHFEKSSFLILKQLLYKIDQTSKCYHFQITFKWSLMAGVERG